MRMIWIAALLLAAGSARAQDGAHVVTIADLKTHRFEWAGSFMRIEKVTITGFSPARGGEARDGTGGVKLDDAGMPTDTISHLARHCGETRTATAQPACRGAIEFTVPAGRGALVIADAQFVPEP